MTYVSTPQREAQALTELIKVERKYGIVHRPSYKTRPIDYIDPAPKPFTIQIPLVEYFERITRLKADRWQHDFCSRLQTAVETRHIAPSFTEYHAEAQLGKTRVLSQVFPAWCFGHDPMFRYVLAMYNMSRSEAHSDVIIQIMRSELHRDIFTNKDGHLPASVSKSGWMTNARRDVAAGQMDAQKSLNPVGLESGMTGGGFDWLTIDDPYKEPKDAFSENMWDNLDRFWRYGVQARLAPHNCVAAMFHRYNYDDFGGYLLNTGKFNYVRYATICDGPYLHDETGQRFEDPLGRPIGEYICPERRKPSYYTANQADSKVWLSMFQGRPGKEEGDFFQVGKIGLILDGIPSADAWAQCNVRGRGWDHAATLNAGDWSAGALMGFQPDGTVIIPDVFSGQLDSAARVEKQKAIAAEDGPDVTVVIPEGLAADGKDVVLLMQQNLREYNVVPRKLTNASPGSDAKKRRAYGFSVAVNSGIVKFLSDANTEDDRKWIDRVKRLMRRFGNSVSGDDEVDALADVYNYLYEEFHKGLVIKDFNQKNLQLRSTFAAKFGLQIPAHWTVYTALKISADSTLPNSGVIVARAAENSGLKDTLFVLDEYKSYTAHFEEMFVWLNTSLKRNCKEPKSSTIWLHPDSESYSPTIRQKLNYGVQVFRYGPTDGIVEANWYTQRDKLIGLVRDPLQMSVAVNSDGLYAMRQEAASWGFNEKGEPSKVASVWDCLRMISHRFRTMASELTENELVEESMPAEYKIAAMLKKAGTKHLTDSQQLARSLMESEVRDKLKIERQLPDWLDDGSRDLDEFERSGGW